MSNALAKNDERSVESTTFRPHADIVEREQDVLVLLDVPGATEESVDVSLEKDELTIRAEVPSEESERRFLVREYAVGDYVRTFRLSDEIDRDGIDATIADGVLRLVLPKVREATPRKVTVKAR